MKNWPVTGTRVLVLACEGDDERVVFDPPRLGVVRRRLVRDEGGYVELRERANDDAHPFDATESREKYVRTHEEWIEPVIIGKTKRTR